MGRVIDASFTGGRRDAPLERTLRICSGPRAGEVLALETPEVVIGRSPSADVRVLDDLVSQFHAKLVQTEDGGHALRDLDSSNGTFVNNELVHAMVLRNGDFIQVGDTVLQYLSSREGEPLEHETVRRAAVPPALAQAAQMMMVRARTTGAELPTAPAVGLPAPYVGQGPVAPFSGLPSAAPVVATEVEWTFKDYLAFAKRAVRFFLPHWKTIVAVALVGSLAGMASFYLRPPPQRAFFEMSLIPDAREARVTNFEPGSVSFFGATRQNFRSMNLLQKTLRDVGIQDPSDELLTGVHQLLEFVEVGEPYDRTRTFLAAFSWKDGEFAVNFLRTHLENYLESEIEKKLKVITVEAEFLRSQANEAKTNLDRVHQALLAFRQENVAAMPDQARQYYELLFDLQRRQSEATREIECLRAAMDLDRARLTRESPLVRSSVTTSRPYEQAIADLNAQLAAARARGQADAHPEVVQLRKQLADLEGLSQRFASEGRGNEVRSVNPEYQDIRTTLRRFEAQREMAKKEADRVEAELKKVKGIVEALPGIEARYQELSREYDALQSVYVGLASKLDATQRHVELERASVAARYDLITPPRLEYFSVAQLIRKRAMMGLVGGLMLGFAVVWVLELRKGNVLSFKPA